MTFALILLGAIAGCFVFRTPLRAFPLIFYALAFVIDIAFIMGSFGGMPREVWSVFFTLIQKCMLPLALFIVVMFIGVIPPRSKAYLWLKPIRAELSIVAWILSLGHMAVYLASYVPRFSGGGTFGFNVVASFVVALVLLVLLLILGVTSFQIIKKHMNKETWKRIQRLSYPFFFLVYVHLLLMLLPSALRGGIAASVSVGVYSVIFIGYGILRFVHMLNERNSVPCT